MSFRRFLRSVSDFCPNITNTILSAIVFVAFCSTNAFAINLPVEWDAPTTNEDGSPLTDLDRFRLYYGTSSGNYTISINLSLSTSYTILGLSPNQTYYFAVTAIDTAGNESGFSNELVYTPVNPPVDPNDIDGDGIPNATDDDDDGDGIDDADEATHGTDPTNADTDGDGVNDGQEVADGTNPTDSGDFNVTIQNTTCSEWNGFLGGMWNFFEHTNMSASNLEVTTTLFSFEGNPVGTETFTLAPGEQRDVAVHDMEGFTTDLYGKVCSNHEGSPGDLDGRMVYYKPVGADFQFAFAMPMTNGKMGTQFVPFNTFHPGNLSYLAANWIQITNNGDTNGSGTLTFYDQLGNVLATEAVSIAAGRRSDISGHQFGASIVGLVQWQPDGASMHTPFILRNVRYLYDNVGNVNSFNSAFQLEGKAGSGESQSVPLNTVNRSAILELVNVTDSAITATVNIYGGISSGAPISISINPKSSFHLITDDILGAGQEGMAVVQTSAANSLSAVAMFYGRAADGSIDFMYGIPAYPEAGVVLRGNYNTFISQSSWLTMVNPAGTSRTVNFTINGQTVERTLPANGFHTEYLNAFAANDTNGVVLVTPDVGNTINAWLLRVRGVEYVVPTPVR